MSSPACGTEEWVSPATQSNRLSEAPSRKKFTFLSTPEGDEFHREKIMPPSDDGIPATRISPARAVASDKQTVVPRSHPNISVKNNIFGTSNLVPNKNTFGANINEPAPVPRHGYRQRSKSPAPTHEMHQERQILFEETKDLLGALESILFDKCSSYEATIKPLQGAARHLLRFSDPSNECPLLSNSPGSHLPATDGSGVDTNRISKNLARKFLVEVREWNEPFDGSVDGAVNSAAKNTFNRIILDSSSSDKDNAPVSVEAIAPFFKDLDLNEHLRLKNEVLHPDRDLISVSARVSEDSGPTISWKEGVGVVGLDIEPIPTTMPVPIQNEEDEDSDASVDAFGNKMPARPGGFSEKEDFSEKDVKALTVKNLAAHTVAILKLPIATGFLTSWPEQEPRDKGIRTPNLGKRPNKKVNRHNHTPYSPAPNPPPEKALATLMVDASSTGIYFEGLPLTTTLFRLINQIRGGAIHSAFIFLAQPGEPKSGVVFFTEPASAERFYASHIKTPFWVDGDFVQVEREVPADILENQYCKLEPIPVGSSRCLKFANIPPNRRDSVQVSRWINGIIGDIQKKELEFDPQTGSCIVRFLSIPTARKCLAKIIEGKRLDFEFKCMYVDYASDPCAMVVQ